MRQQRLAVCRQMYDREKGEKMDSSDSKKWHNLLMAALCVVIVLGLGFLFWTPAHSVVNRYFIPAGEWPGFSFGTCSNDDNRMTYTSMTAPTYTDSFLYLFGESEPAAAPAMPPMLDYLPKKDTIDVLAASVNINATEESVIGLYELPDSRLLIIDNGTTLTELLETGKGIRISALVPRLVGSRHTGANETGYHQHGAYNSSTENDVAVHRIDLVLPGPGNATVPLYIVNKTRTDTFFSRDGVELASVSTTGTFYVLYGQRVDRVLYGSAISHDTGWKVCSQKIGMSMNGATGELRHTVKLAQSSERILHAHLIVTGPYIQVYEGSGGSTSEWISRDSTGCSC